MPSLQLSTTSYKAVNLLYNIISEGNGGNTFFYPILLNLPYSFGCSAECYYKNGEGKIYYYNKITKINVNYV